MDCYTKKVGRTVIRRRLDGLIHKEDWLDCFKVGWTVSQKRLDRPFHKNVGWPVSQRRLAGLFQSWMVRFTKKAWIDFFIAKVG